MSFRLSRVIVCGMTFLASASLATSSAFAGHGCVSGCGGHPVPEPSTMILLAVAVPGSVAWVKRKRRD